MERCDSALDYYSAHFSIEHNGQSQLCSCDFQFLHIN
jgi:hypothetical protein